FSYDTLKSAIQAGFPKYWVEQGFTSAYSFAEAAEIKIYQELFQNGTLPMRIQVMVHNSSNTPEPLECLMKLGILPGLMGNDWLKMGGVKIFLDGAFMALTAASNQPYLNLPEKNYHGILRLEPNFFKELVKKAHDGGLQICVHAMGDKAQDLALDAYENALRSNPRSHRHRIEHFGCDMGSPQQRRRARELGIVPVTTIGWLYAYGDFIETYLGPQRKEQSFALRSMHDDGLKPANASDQCGTEPVTLDPFFGIWCAVTRQTFFGKQFVPRESISVNEALRMWTTNAAYSGFEEHIKGSLEPGKFADMIVISHDILSVPEDRIKEIKVDMTIIDGKIVYERQQI
ncbi:MAG: amidohydrolase family protein, partial [Proteobacteria bacterium]|nr:amidohydrolase family protein [Pseudomonadota bacterium]